MVSPFSSVQFSSFLQRFSGFLLAGVRGVQGRPGVTSWRPLWRCPLYEVGAYPSFTKKTEKPDHYRMFNARSESVKEKASFRRLIPHNRCLVAVEGYSDNGYIFCRYYEWKKDGSKKQPYYIHFKDGRPLVFAALYDLWKESEGEILYTFTILTTRSSTALEWLHDRMPVIFGSKDTIDTWLSNSPPKLEALLTPYADFDLVWYPVTPAMGKPSFEGPECIKEIQLKPSVQNQISKLFSKKSDDNINKCKAEPEFMKSADVFSENENPKSLKEEPAMVDTKELADEKRHKSDDSPSAEKRTVGPELRGIKRDLEEMEPDFEVKTELSDSYSTSVKKKVQSGGKQSSPLLYFGRK
ncbi:hypothetical protein IEQ34_007048 [Dendrobium chrysotoxum]|uniref:Embryonic stem cell-specific 5-hydroxymethylcytosine-binding protein n=1 Tax=Dendrobium chrysotoxum TaxID=161865 RepID=A0AAV7H5Q4_DENCH|nr:hypothetical protein IEQ34_007048 [Dendrobium chrysotoxum]